MLIILTQFSRLTPERNKWLAMSSGSVGVLILQLKIKDIQGNYAVGPNGAMACLGCFNKSY